MKKSIELRLLIIMTAIISSGCDWRDNPFAKDRISWDKYNSEVHGESFTFTTPVEYIVLNKHDKDSFSKPVRDVGRIINVHVNINTTQPLYSKDKYIIEPISDKITFNIKKSVLVEVNAWKFTFSGNDRRVFIVHDSNGVVSAMPASSFAFTTLPYIQKLDPLYINFEN